MCLALTDALMQLPLQLECSAQVSQRDSQVGAHDGVVGRNLQEHGTHGINTVRQVLNDGNALSLPAISFSSSNIIMLSERPACMRN
jgi:hypothetical protein